MNQDENSEVNIDIKKRRRAGAAAHYEVFTEDENEVKKEEPKIEPKKIKIDEIDKDEKKSRRKKAVVADEIDNNAAKPKKEKKVKAVKDPNVPKSKKHKIIITSLIILYLLVLSGVIFAGSFVGKRMALLNFEALDKEDLGIEENVFDGQNMNITKAQFDQIKTIAILGTDNRLTSDEKSRSDVNMVVSINPTTKSIKMISVPRDTYVQINGSRDKMAHAYFYGGPQLSVKTLNQNFGLNITEYVTIDFYGVINAINKLGGVNIDITEAERDYINKWTNESYGFSGAPYKKLTVFGKQTLLNGEQALAHARNRSIGNDFTRAERQRTVLTAVLNKLSKMDLQTAMDLIDTMLVEVKTNINISEYLKFIPELYASKDAYLSNIVSAQVPATEDIRFETINGLSCVVTDLTKQKSIFKNYIFNM